MDFFRNNWIQLSVNKHNLQEFYLLGYCHVVQTTRRYIPEDRTLHNHRCEKLKPCTSMLFIKSYVSFEV
jgi:hypothetical protein